VNQLNDAERNIITIDPVEYQFAGINQIQVNEKADHVRRPRSMRLDPT
jgi:type II secretory ATPase GspE/PulE/Tfp pilus assembly ATPase PilB-like protein